MLENIVLKFGGSVLENEKSMSKAAIKVKQFKEKGIEVSVVVSAIGGVTDNLFKMARNTSPDAPPEYIDNIISMGERTSARIFAAALKASGLEPVVVDPDSSYWPIITDSKHLDANPIVSETERLVSERILPLLKKSLVPIICGFIGRSLDGKITTLGRGGSDTTAVLLGRMLKSKEVVLIKDVDKVFSSDPDKVEDAMPLSALDSEEALALSVGGAKFLHHKAIRYKDEHIKIRILGLDSDGSGTVIDGKAISDLNVEALHEQATMVTIVGLTKDAHHQLGDLLKVVSEAGGKVVSVGSELRSMVIYVIGGKKILRRLHSHIVNTKFGKAVSSFDDLVMIAIKGPALETSPGLIQKVTQPLAKNGINIFGIVTVSSSIRVFVLESDRDKSLKLLRKTLFASDIVGEEKK